MGGLTGRGDEELDRPEQFRHTGGDGNTGGVEVQNGIPGVVPKIEHCGAGGLAGAAAHTELVDDGEGVACDMVRVPLDVLDGGGRTTVRGGGRGKRPGVEQHVGGGEVRVHDAFAEGEGGKLADRPPNVVLAHPGLTVTTPGG
ncbi:hypothetical protein [Streptomyces sp. LBL]|uniref:hypothetical protein n=1 Tax=Streptomyces sp. LBL TaxID=2940562 RepID=UPI002472EF80|nr:hypothetical protein [Streptomyces sp. LBL]